VGQKELLLSDKNTLGIMQMNKGIIIFPVKRILPSLKILQECTIKNTYLLPTPHCCDRISFSTWDECRKPVCRKHTDKYILALH
jgi:hypothetical protein